MLFGTQRLKLSYNWNVHTIPPFKSVFNSLLPLGSSRRAIITTPHSSLSQRPSQPTSIDKLPIQCPLPIRSQHIPNVIPPLTQPQPAQWRILRVGSFETLPVRGPFNRNKIRADEHLQHPSMAAQENRETGDGTYQAAGQNRVFRAWVNLCSKILAFE